MTTSFQEFRDRYPKGALVADLISIYDGQYVVRASVVLTGEAIATGLAADQSLEAAEDKARDRALAILGLSTSSQSHSSQSHSAEEADLAAKTPVAEISSETVEALPLPDLDPQLSTEEELEPEEPEEDLGPPIDAVVEQSPSAAQKPSAAAIALENFNTSALPVDLSDVIAQTDVELRRLGWTSVQGQEYLEKTYGKRSRRQLTDDELMSFLLYLESLEN